MSSRTISSVPTGRNGKPLKGWQLTDHYARCRTYVENHMDNGFFGSMQREGWHMAYCMAQLDHAEVGDLGEDNDRDNYAARGQSDDPIWNRVCDPMWEYL